MNKLNTFNNYYSPWKYPKNWVSNIRCFLSSFKYSYQRITKGYCDKDLWDLSSYYLKLLSSTLNEFSNITEGWPDQKFSSFEDWQSHIRIMSKKFYTADEDADFYPHPAQDKWLEYVKDKPLPFSIIPDNKDEIEKGLSDKMLSEDYKIKVKREKDFEEALAMLNEVFWHLWD